MRTIILVAVHLVQSADGNYIVKSTYPIARDKLERRIRKKFIVATDNGLFHKMKQAAPDKILLEAPIAGKGATCVSCAHCPWMAMNGLRNLAQVLETGGNEITIDKAVRERAALPIRRLLEFAKQRKRVVLGNNDA